MRRFLPSFPVILVNTSWLVVLLNVWLCIVPTHSAKATEATRSALATPHVVSITAPFSQTTAPVSVTPVSLVLTQTATAVCAGAPVTLALSGCPASGTIRWSGGQTAATITVQPAQTTTYIATCSVTVPVGSTATTPQGSTTTASATVSVDLPIVIAKQPVSLSSCEGLAVSFSVEVTGGSGVSVWSRNGATLPGVTGGLLTFPSVSVAQAGDYTFSASNLCGKVASSAARLAVSPGLTANNNPSAVLCAGTSTGQILVGVSGGTGTRQFQLNGDAFQASNTFTGLKAGTYVVTVKDAVGCTTQTQAVVTQPDPIALTIKAVNAKCSGGADGGIVVAATGGNGSFIYQLNGGKAQTGDTFFDLKDNTTYTVTATDQLGCTLSKGVLISAPQPFDIKATIASAKCAGSADGTITLSTTGGTGSYQYQISANGFQAGALFTGLPANTYDISVKDGNGCVGTKRVTVSQPPPLKLTASVIPVNCFGPNSGSITLTPSGGTGSVQYQLTAQKTNQRSNLFKNIAVGDYTVVGTDSNGCTALLPVTVGKSDPLTLQASPVPATCCVCPTGRVVLASAGGTGTGRSFQLIGRGYQASNQFGKLPPATYQFRVQDEVGCTDSTLVIITDASAMSLTPGRIKDVPCTGGRDGEAAVQLTGGTKPFTFYWQTEAKDTLKTRTQTQTGLREGTYTISVIDSNRCTTTTTFVTVKALAPIPPKPVITQTSTMLSVIEITGVQWYFRADTSAGKPVPNATQSSLIPYQSGQYYVIVTQNGCVSPRSDFATFVLTALAEPDPALSMRVVPNPITDRLRVEIEQTDHQAVQIQLLDASGRAVRDYQLPAFTGKKQAEWPLAGVPTGLYLLKAEAGSRQSAIRVVVE